MRQQCVSEMLYRVQKPKETLADIVSDLQSLADILLAEFGEQDLLDTILTGLNPAMRARLAGFPPPTTVDNLYALSPRIDRSEWWYAHGIFQPGRGQRSFTNPRYRSSNHGSSNQNNIHFTSSNLKAKGGH
ncbi:hypothetical protein J6590_069798 [Homalodisca vitripennis]|nr:hypothetical protein J6590_069798 [Homalodisca vitripennis]